MGEKRKVWASNKRGPQIKNLTTNLNTSRVFSLSRNAREEDGWKGKNFTPGVERCGLKCKGWVWQRNDKRQT